MIWWYITMCCVPLAKIWKFALIFSRPQVSNNECSLGCLLVPVPGWLQNRLGKCILEIFILSFMNEAHKVVQDNNPLTDLCPIIYFLLWTGGLGLLTGVGSQHLLVIELHIFGFLQAGLHLRLESRNKHHK